MNQGPDEDLALVESARAGEQDAFEELFNKYRDRAAAVAFKYTHNREDALDIVQDAFMKAFASLASFRGQSRFSHWLFRIVANRAIDVFRKRKPGQVTYDEARESEGIVTPDTNPDADPVRGAQSREVFKAYEEAVELLSTEHRAVFALHVMQGMRYGEISETLGVPLGTVMSRLHYARKHLRKLLGKFMTDEQP